MNHIIENHIKAVEILSNENDLSIENLMLKVTNEINDFYNKIDYKFINSISDEDYQILQKVYEYDYMICLKIYEILLN